MGKFSLFYFTLKQIMKPWYRSYYKSILVEGLENLHPNRPKILAANHQNALMDPLLMIFSMREQPWFLARADLFKNPILAFLLNLIRIIPIYRIRDGKETLNQNQEQFKAVSKLLRMGNTVGIFPEANHAEPRKLRILKKGITRIAFQAAIDSNWEMAPEIIPVGITYSKIQSHGQRVLVLYGKAIRVSEFRALHEESEILAHNALREAIATAIGKRIVDIRKEEEMDSIETLRWLDDSHLDEPLSFPENENEFRTMQAKIKRLEEGNRLSAPAVAQNKFVKQLQTCFPHRDAGYDYSIYHRWNKQSDLRTILKGPLMQLLLIPFTLLWGLPYWGMNLYVKYYVADPCFKSTMQFGYGWAVVLLWSAVLSGLLSFYATEIPFWVTYPLAYLSASLGMLMLNQAEEYRIYRRARKLFK